MSRKIKEIIAPILKTNRKNLKSKLANDQETNFKIMSVEYSGNVVVAGDADKVNEFIQKHNSLPYSYEPWHNGGYDAITFFDHKGDFDVDFWKEASKDYPELKLIAKYQQELAAAYICTIQAGKVVQHICFDWNDGGIISWSD